MVNVIEQLQAYGIPHTSYMQAIRFMQTEQAEMSLEDTYMMIANLSTPNPKIMDDTVANDLMTEYFRLVLLYLIQESIRASFTQSEVFGEDILPIAITKAKQYMAENAWAFVKPEEPEEIINPLTGKAKMKKGKKQELANEIYKEHRGEAKEVIIELFQKELDMSKSGARTYYYNMRNKFGDNE